MTGIILGQYLYDLLDFLMKGASALPILLVLALVMGRRGNGAFCLWAGANLGRFALFISCAGPLAILLGYILQMLALRGHNYWTTFFSRPAMNSSVTLLLWLAGMAAFFWALKMLANDERQAAGAPKTGHSPAPANPVVWSRAPDSPKKAGKGNRSQNIFIFGALKWSMLWLLCGGMLFFMTFVSAHWPFAGLPADLPRDRAMMAIFRHAARSYFMALAPAGALACAWAASRLEEGINRFGPEVCNNGLRWCAFWAFIGYLPHCLQNWGIALGAGARGGMDPVRQFGLLPQIVTLTLLTGGMICFAFILFRPRPRSIMAFIGLGLFLCAAISGRLCLALAGQG